LDELSKLDEEISKAQKRSGPNQPMGCGLVGPPGVGKTRVAAEYARVYGPKRFSGGVFWIDASVSGSYFEEGLYEVTRRLRPGVAELQVLRASGRAIAPVLVRALQERPLDEPLLLILDGLTEQSRLGLNELLNNISLVSNTVSVLTTSRDVEPIRDAPIALRHLPILPHDEAVALLTQKLNRSSADPHTWQALAERAGYLPLALVLLNRSFRDHSLKPTELFSRSRDSTPNTSPPEPVTGSPKVTVRTPSEPAPPSSDPLTFALQTYYQRLFPKVRRAARLFAQLAPIPIPIALVQALIETVLDEETIEKLWRSALIQPMTSPVTGLSEPVRGLDTIHSACAPFLREQNLRPVEDLLLLCDRLKRAFVPDPAGSVRDLSLLNLCLPHGDELLSRLSQRKLSEDEAIPAIELGMQMGVARRAQNLYSELERNDRGVWDFAVAQLGEHHLQTLACIENYLLTLQAQGKSEEASVLRNRTASMRPQIIESDGQEGLKAVHALTSINNASLALKAQGKLQEARELQERSLRIRREVLGLQHPLTFTAMNNLAATLYHLGDLPGARNLLEQAIALRTKALGKEHPSTLSTMEGLASLLTAEDDLQRAIQILEQVLAIREKNFGDKHPSTLATMNNLGLVLAVKGDLDESRRLLERALTIQRGTQSDDHPARLACLASLAPLLRMQGDLEAERKIREEELSVRRSAMGIDCPDTITAMGKLVATLVAKGSLREARALQEEELAICMRVFGEGHGTTIASMNNLAVILQRQGELENAGKLLEQVVEIHKKTLGELHRDTLTSMNNLASLIKARGDLEGARWLQEQILEKRKEVLGPEHPDTLTSMNNLAATLRARGDLERSRGLQEKVIRLRAKVLGSEHPDTLTSMNNLASVLKAKGKLASAKKLQEHVLEKRKLVLGADHPDTLTSMNNLASSLKAEGQLEAALELEREVLDIRKGVLGIERPATTIAAWNYTSTLIRLKGRSVAQSTIEETLLWLLHRDRETLAAPQRQIQEMLKKLIQSG
jgi:tetratricopeptide (TPR) repeat protein